VTDLLVYGPLVVVVTFGLGWGLTRLLVPGRLQGWEAAFAPWIGMVQTTAVLTIFGYVGVGVDRAWPVAAAVGVVAWAAGRVRGRRGATAGRTLAIGLLVLAVVAVLMAPVTSRAGKLNTFAISNNDPFSYVVSAQWVKERGLFPLPSQLRRDATADNNVDIQLGYNPRWLPVLYLAFLSSLLRVDPVALFSIVQSMVFALQFPLVWLLGRQVVGLGGVSARVAFLLAALNPYATYVTLHGFLPQVMGTGYFLGFLVLAAPYLEVGPVRWREWALLAIFGTGVLTSYLELVPFALLTFAGYALWTAWRRGGWGSRAGRAALVLVAVAGANPFHLTRVAGFLWSHVVAVSATDMRSGWPMPGSYTAVGGLLTEQKGLLWGLLFGAVLTLAVAGIAVRQRRRAYVLFVAWPLVASAVIAYRADYSYAFFKSQTYVYYLLPLVVGTGLAACARWLRRLRAPRPSVYAFRAVLLVVVALVLIGEARETRWLWRKYWRHPRGATVALAPLEAVNREARVNDVFLSGLDFWESLWAVYYLRDKRVGMPARNGYVYNRAGFIEDGRWRFVVTREGRRSLFDSGERRITGPGARMGPFTFGELEPRPVRETGSIRLVAGFPDVEHNAHEEWAWVVGRTAELEIDWPGDSRAAYLNLRFGSGHDQRMTVSLNDHPVCTLPVAQGPSRRYTIPLVLKAGPNRVALSSDREPPPHVSGDPRRLNVRVYWINVGLTPSNASDPARRPRADEVHAGASCERG
jgi:hypothetical protein